MWLRFPLERARLEPHIRVSKGDPKKPRDSMSPAAFLRQTSEKSEDSLDSKPCCFPERLTEYPEMLVDSIGRDNVYHKEVKDSGAAQGGEKGTHSSFLS